MTKKLVFDALEEEGELEDLDLTLNGTTYPLSKPTTGQIAILMAAFSEETPAPDMAKAILDFYRNLSIQAYQEYDEEDEGVPGTELPTAYDAVRGILRNPRIPDSLEQMIRLTEKVVELVTGNPTKRPADYLPSQRNGGSNSTGQRRRPASTRSRSPRPGSATGSTRSSSRD
jgi:hypothetical protein